MIRFIASLAAIVFIMAGCSGNLHAQFLLDGFLNDTIEVFAPGSPSSVITNNIEFTTIDRQISVEAAGTFSIVSTVTSGVLVVDAGGSGSGSASAQLEYLGFNVDLGSDTYFQFTVSKVVGTPIAGLILQNSAATVLSGGVQLTPTNTTTSFFVDITQLAGYTPAFGQSLNSVTLVIGGADQDFFVEGNSIQFSSVPEPSIMVLTGLGLVPFVFGRRARRTF
ncbi:MAG: PEP-CTERM sorting domain-containing protein [Terrimicrobiaceae bacterium]